MGRTIAVVVLIGLTTLGVSDCSEVEPGRVEGAASEIGAVASELRDVVGQLQEELREGQEQLVPESGQDADSADQPDEADPAPSAPELADVAAEDDADGVPLWVILLLAALLVLLIVAVVAGVRRSREAADRRRRLRDEALLETDWLVDAASERPSAVDAAPRARDVRVRADRLSDALRRLEGLSSQRGADTAAELRAAAVALARATIARLDDAAAGRQPRGDLGVDELVQQTRTARDRFVDVS